jgi:putative DNA primase/helicase
MPAFSFSMGRGVQNTKASVHNAGNFPDFSDAVLGLRLVGTRPIKPKSQAEKLALPWFAPPFADGLRSGESASPWPVLVMDVDKCEVDVVHPLVDYLRSICPVFGYTTSSHAADAPRFRMMFSMSRNITVDESKLLAKMVEEKVYEAMPRLKGKVHFDPTQQNAGQPALLPCAGFQTIPLKNPDAPRLDVDDWLAPLAGKPAIALSPRQPKTRETPETPEKIAEVESALMSISADCTRARWLAVLFAIRSTGWASSERLAREWSASAPHRYSEADFDKAWGKGRERDGNRPKRRLATVFHYARKEGWSPGEDCGSVWTDDGMACLVASFLKGRAMCVKGTWYAWTGTHWRADRETVEAWLKDWAAERAGEAVKEAMRDPDDGRAKLGAKAFQTLRNVQKQRNVLASLQIRLRVDPALLDADPYLLACTNGTVDIRTGKLRAPDPADRLTHCTGHAYDPNAPCPTWESFLSQALPDESIRDWFHRFLGSSLTGDVREEVLMLCIGVGGSGKSTALNAVMHAMGDYSVAASPALLSKASFKRDANEHTAAMIPLIGRRLVALNEVAKGEVYNDATLKALTSTEPVSMRRSGGTDQFTVQPTWHLWIRGNHRPSFTSTDGGVSRRLALVEFMHIPAQKDLRLDEKLRPEAPGILRWLVDGALAWQARGLKQPSVMHEAVKAYMGSLDVFGEWLADRTEQGGYTSRGDLMADYATYLGSDRRSLPTTRAFYAMLRERGVPEATRDGGTRGFKITLRPELDGLT